MRIVRGVITVAAVTASVIAVGAWSSSSSSQRLAAAPGSVALHQAEVPALAAYTRSHSDEFAGLYLDNATGTVYVDVAAGASSAAAGLADEIASQSRAAALSPARHAGRQLALVTRVVRYSQRQLEATMAQITTRQPWAGHIRGLLVSWGVDPKSDTVLVGLTRVSRQVAELADATFGDRVSLMRQEPFSDPVGEATVKHLKIVRIPASTRAKMAAVTREGRRSPAVAPQPSRLLDTPLYFGGDRIITPVTDPITGQTGVRWCTGGFTWTAPAMSTAGHCGPTGTVWYQGYYDASTQTVYVSGTMGTAFSTQFGDGRIDAQLMNFAGSATNYAPAVYTGLTTSVTVAGSKTPFVGQEGICADGSVTFQNCDGRIDQVNRCFVVGGVNTCGLDQVNSVHGTVLGGPGDSGGPVYFYSDQSQVTAVGIISGGNSSGTSMVMTDIGQMINIMNDGTVETP